MSSDYLYRAAANRMINAAEARKIRVFERHFAGASEVFADFAPQAVAQYLRDHGAYRGPVTMDGGLHLRLPDGTQMFQGQEVLDRWIESNA